MKYVMKDRAGIEYKVKEPASLKILYGTLPGRICIKFITLSFISKLSGKILSNKCSKILIKRYINKYNIDLSNLEKDKFSSFNDFFTRKKKNISIKYDKNTLISVCDGKLMVYDITKDGLYNIKGSNYTIKDLFNNDKIYKNYIGEKMLVFRLTPDDYHRYIYPDSGYENAHTFIKGVFHTVRPTALKKVDVYKKNSREYALLKTDNFGDVVMMEVGALLVGKIDNYHENYMFKKGEEKGKFLYGGSTIVLLIKNSNIDIDSDILINSKNNIETIVKIGKRIGKRH